MTVSATLVKQKKTSKNWGKFMMSSIFTTSLVFPNSPPSELGEKMNRNQELPKFDLPPRKNPKLHWRTRIVNTQLISQASSILLQRHSKFWAPLFRRLNLSPNFSPFLFHQILNKIKNHPRICLSFFNYAEKNLDFKPDVKAQCEVTRILLGSELSALGLPILNSIIQDNPPTKFLPLLIQSPEAHEPETISRVLNSVVECYCNKRLHLQGLEVYQIAKRYGVGLGLGGCNSLLNLLCDKDEFRLAWCCFASMIRIGVSGDRSTWSVVARILYEEGKFERISRILDTGIYAHEMFDLMIDGHSRRGNFEAASAYLNKMCSKEIEPSFGTYSVILDGACKYQDQNMIESIKSLMVEKGHISDPSSPNFDTIIQKLCSVGRTFAMELFYKRACDEEIELQHVTYECMLKALSSGEGRVKDAIQLFNVMQEKNISANESCYNEFVDALCKEKPSQEVSNLIANITKVGIVSEANGLSTYISKLCSEDQWREAEELMEILLDRGFQLDPMSCGSFVKQYCHTGRIDKAVMLHNRLEELTGTLDVATYEVFLAVLFEGRMVEEATKVFDHMRSCNTLSSGSFSIMIRGLCGEKEFRKAMKLHDEMMELGLKPDLKTYKGLISGFG